MNRIIILIFLISASLGTATSGATAALAQSGRRGATRVDFDDALIKGQTKRGAVHLLERRDSELGSLVKKRVHFRDEILCEVGLEADTPGLQRLDIDGNPIEEVLDSADEPLETDVAETEQ